MKNFAKIKEIIATRCREKSACSTEYGKLIKSENFTELLTVLTANWAWAAHNGILDGDVLDKFGKEALTACNVVIYDRGDHQIETGFCYAKGSATVSAYGNSTVSAYGNSTVSAYGNSTVRAYGNSTVRADGNSTVRADGNSTVSADGNSTVRAYGNSTVSADGNSTVRADGRATINSYNSNGHEVKQYAICRFVGSWPDYDVYKIEMGAEFLARIQPPTPTAPGE